MTLRYKIYLLKDQLDYDEHYYEPEKKSKFNFLEVWSPLEDPYKYSRLTLLKDRKNPHQWIEFKNSQGDYYVVAYFHLGGYVVRIGIKNSNSWSLNNPKLKIFREFDWYEKLKKNHRDVINSKNLFSMTETSQIVADVTKINKLSVFG